MRIGIDLDGTIVDTYTHWLHVLQQTPMADRFTAVDLLDHHNDPDLFQFVEQNREEMFGRPPEVPGAVSALHRLLSQGHQLYFISARHPDLLDVTQRWLSSHSLPQDRLFLLTGGDKAALCVAEGVTLMAEDSPYYAPLLAARGIQVWLRDTEYNQHVGGPGIERFWHWSEIVHSNLLQIRA